MSVRASDAWITRRSHLAILRKERQGRDDERRLIRALREESDDLRKENCRLNQMFDDFRRGNQALNEKCARLQQEADASHKAEAELSATLQAHLTQAAVNQRLQMIMVAMLDRLLLGGES